jgi:hypothetical protein
MVSSGRDERSSHQILQEVPAMRLPRKMTRRWIIAMAAALGTLTGYTLLVSVWLFLPPWIDDWRHRQAFNAPVWQSQGQSGHDARWPPRLCMSDDLLASGRLSGRTEGQIIELLGPPTDRASAIGDTGPEISYHLGMERGTFGIDSETLRIRFGPAGKVERAWVHRD